MSNLNRVMLMGRLTRDPELRYTPNNTAVVNIGLAIGRKWKNQQTNEMQEETTFIDIEAWGKTGEVLNQYLKKGRPVYIEGRLKLDTWQDKETGQNRSKVKVVCEEFQFIDSKQDDGGERPASTPASQPQPRGAGQRRQPVGAGASAQHSLGGQNNGEPIDEDDIPF